MKTLYIIRGCPGAGKTTYAQSLGIPYFEADQYFMRNGKYMFDPGQLSAAHRWCTTHVEIACHTDSQAVGVSNTSPRLKDILPYIHIGRQSGRKIIIVELMTRHGSVHDITEDTMARCERRWVSAPDELVPGYDYKWYDELIRIE